MSNETQTRKWRANLHSGSALIAATPETDRHIVVTVFYVNRDGTPDAKWFITSPEEVVPTAKTWIEQNLGPIQHLVEEPVQLEPLR